MNPKIQTFLTTLFVSNFGGHKISFFSSFKGYNHPALLNAFNDPEKMATLVNRPALGVYPGHEWPKMLRESLMSCAPKGLENGHVCFN